MAARRRLAKVAACVQSGSNSTGSAAPPRLGFVGIGTINSAVIRGLCTAASADDALPPLHWPIMVGPRNAAKAAALVSEFPSLVRQASTNQEVLDGSDVVLLGTPGGADSLREVCSALRWRTDHRVISLVAGAPYELLSDATQPAAAATIALPLPPAEWHASTTKVFPRNQEAEALMSRLGTVLAFDSFEQMVTLGVGSLMGHFCE
jgi:pyrroline-5-carboxylate reductase